MFVIVHANPLVPVIDIADADFIVVMSALDESLYPAINHRPDRMFVAHPVDDISKAHSELAFIVLGEPLATLNLTICGLPTPKDGGGTGVATIAPLGIDDT